MLKSSDSVLFVDLFKGDETRIDVVVSFLAVLEMGKLKMIKIYQPSAFDPIRLQRVMEITPDVVNKEIGFEEDYR